MSVRDEVTMRGRAMNAIAAVSKDFPDTGADIKRYVDFLADDRMRLHETQRTATPCGGEAELRAAVDGLPRFRPYRQRQVGVPDGWIAGMCSDDEDGCRWIRLSDVRELLNLHTRRAALASTPARDRTAVAFATSDIPDDELREQLAACREDWQRVCDALGAQGAHMDPCDVLREIGRLTAVTAPTLAPDLVARFKGALRRLAGVRGEKQGLYVEDLDTLEEVMRALAPGDMDTDAKLRAALVEWHGQTDDPEGKADEILRFLQDARGW